MNNGNRRAMNVKTTFTPRPEVDAEAKKNELLERRAQGVLAGTIAPPNERRQAAMERREKK